MRQDPATANGTWWRVLWVDHAGEGRFDDVMAENAPRAAWLVTDYRKDGSAVADLVNVVAIDDKEARP